MGWLSFMTEDIAIDLGTANTLITYQDKVVVDSPSIVAQDRRTGQIIAVGKEARQMHGKTHENIKTIRPLKDGVIADFEASEYMIRELIKSIPAFKKRLFPPSLRMVVCIPSGITEVEKRAVRDSAEHANAKEVYLIHEPMAAAVGIAAATSSGTTTGTTLTARRRSTTRRPRRAATCSRRRRCSTCRRRWLGSRTHD